MSESERPATISKKAIAGVPWLLVSKFFLFFVYFGISIIIVRSLGSEQYGLYSICRSLADYGIVLVGLGLNATLMRFIPELCVKENRSGLLELIAKVAVAQCIACICLAVLLLSCKQQLNEWFRTDFGVLLPFCGLLLFSLSAKDFLNDTQTSLFRGREVAIFSMLQGGLWLLFTLAAAYYYNSVTGMLVSQIASNLIVVVLAGLALGRYLFRLSWRSTDHEIGRKRLLKMSLPTWGNNVARALMLKYTEVFMLGIFTGTAAAGAYDLGYSIPLLVITFIPMAVQTLMTASVSEAYSRDTNCLPKMISGIYKLLIILSVPLAAFGLFYASRGIVLIYGEEMVEAGPIAASFCVIHLFPLISIPLSMAIQAKEKVHNMFPLMILQVCVNLALDLLLIPKFGIPGAISAVVLTFVLTIPLRLRAVQRLVGGIYFPGKFFFRVMTPCLAVAGGFWVIFPTPSLFGLVSVSIIYLLVILAGIRYSVLISDKDKRLFLDLVSGKAAKVFSIVFGLK
ncbi:MAG: oligosaccharide flippase family protein [Verrucomicrobiota bacterium]